MNIAKLIISAGMVSLITAPPLTIKLDEISAQRSRDQQSIIKHEQELNALKTEAQKQSDSYNKLKEQNDRLQEQLQSKRDEQSKLAAQQAEKPAVSISVPKATTASCEQYRAIVAQYDWDVDTAMAVMRAESGCDTSAVSTTCDRGLMQVNCIHSDLVNGNLTALFDPSTNIKCAYAIYRGSHNKWTPWTTFTSGAYLRYL